MSRAEADLYVETKYEVVYEDEFFLAVDKPAPLPVHPVGRFKEKNLLSLLQRDFGAAGDGFRIVNRLDSETSGLLLVAKGADAAGKLGTLFEKRSVYKEYWAVVLGAPEPRQGTITAALGTELRNSQRIRVPDPDGEPAETGYEVLSSGKEFSYVKITPKTGRTHQIRAHLSFIGCPVAGDKIYIDPAVFERYVQEGWKEDMRPIVRAERLLLHASKLEFRHPMTGREIKFHSSPDFPNPV